MNAGGVDKACKSNGPDGSRKGLVGIVANELVTRRYLPCTRAQPAERLANSRWSRKSKAPAVRERSAAYQLVGEVMAHQGYDG